MSSVKSILPNDVLESAIRRVHGNDKITVEKVTSTIPSLGGEHFLSEVEYCDVDIIDGGESKQVNLFIKKQINAEKITAHVEQMSAPAFDTEITVYDVLLRHIVDFCRRNETTPIDTNFFPVCYYTGTVGKEKVLAMENLVNAGYKMHPGRGLSQDMSHVVLVMTSLATFHASAYVMEKKSGVDFMKKYNLTNLMEGGANLLESVSSVTFKVTVNILKEAPNCLELARKLERFAPHTVETLMRGYRPGNGINVLCHGDFHNNNMMFLYDDDGKPIKMKMVDWQVTTSSSACRDFCVYLYGSVKPEIRRKRLPHILRTYYDQFSRVAQSLGAGDAIFTFEKFVEEYRSFKLFAMIIGAMSIAMNPVMSSVDKDKEKDKDQEFDFNYMMQHAEDPNLASRLPEELKFELIELMKGCAKELDVFLSNV